MSESPTGREPCCWRGGNDFLECGICGLEFDYRKSLMPPCGAAARIAELERIVSESMTMNQNTRTVESIIAEIEEHHNTKWGTRAVLSPPDERLYRAAGIAFVEKRLWQQGDVDFNEIRSRGCIVPDSCIPIDGGETS